VKCFPSSKPTRRWRAAWKPPFCIIWFEHKRDIGNVNWISDLGNWNHTPVNVPEYRILTRMCWHGYLIAGVGLSLLDGKARFNPRPAFRAMDDGFQGSQALILREWSKLQILVRRGRRKNDSNEMWSRGPHDRVFSDSSLIFLSEKITHLQKSHWIQWNGERSLGMQSCIK
jgi:hypothetical protein